MIGAQGLAEQQLAAQALRLRLGQDPGADRAADNVARVSFGRGQKLAQATEPESLEQRKQLKVKMPHT